MPDHGQPAPPPSIFVESRRPTEASRRLATLLALLVAAALAVAATMWFAVGWAADLPKTIAFAIRSEPFGSRSLLETGNARAALARLTARLDPRDEAIGLHLHADRMSLVVRAPDGARRHLGTTILGDVDDGVTMAPARRRGVPARQLATLDLDAALTAARDRWRALPQPEESPMVSLRLAPGRLQGWSIVFHGGVPEPQRTTHVDLRGRPVA